MRSKPNFSEAQVSVGLIGEYTSPQAYCEAIFDVGREVMGLVVLSTPIYGETMSQQAEMVKNCTENEVAPSYLSFANKKSIERICTGVINGHMYACGVSGYQGDQWFKSYFFVIQYMLGLKYKGHDKMCVH